MISTIFVDFGSLYKREVFALNTLSNIEALLKAQKKTQKELCDFLGINGQAFTNWKNGNSKSYKKYLPEIAKFFNVSVDAIVCESSGYTDPHTIGYYEVSTNPQSVDLPIVKPVEHKSKLFDLPEVVGVDADRQKMAELLGMIAKKPSAKKDMDDVLTYLEFIAKRGE